MYVIIYRELLNKMWFVVDLHEDNQIFNWEKSEIIYFILFIIKFNIRKVIVSNFLKTFKD